MSIFDDMKGKADGLISGHEDATKDGVEKTGDFVDSKTGDKFKDHVDTAQRAASDYVDGSDK
ncbi:antitoxin [Arthrobacter antibioticus]|uniref:antitoxin n=1 Tax=Arthrobacter sp. H35-MC1 TaxID=3046203 RepID=UPI0024B8D8F9|nr:antitoxin [Arthrobacter sp. H35-MC1]MDJ0318079.1 antitoxin [Arthrobacter sp. H35-MC1]